MSKEFSPTAGFPFGWEFLFSVVSLWSLMKASQPSQRSATMTRFITMFALVMAGEAIFGLPFLVARIFRPTLLDVFGITNLELGTAFSFYGVVALLAYLPGGPIARGGPGIGIPPPPHPPILRRPRPKPRRRAPARNLQRQDEEIRHVDAHRQ